MRIIALEEHLFPRDIIEAEGLDLGSRAGKRVPQLDDLGDGRLAVMDAAGIDVQVLSALSYFVQGLEPSRSIPIHRDLNDRTANAVEEHPDRFRAFAALPMADAAAAADELTRCVQELGFLGAMVHGQTNGVFLDAPSMRPVLAAAVRLDVPVYLHPAPPPKAIVDTYYSDLEPEAAACLSTSGWGWHAELGMHVLRMVANGVFEELPELKLIVGHMGEGLPFHIDRIESMLNPVVARPRQGGAGPVRPHQHRTTAGDHFDVPLQAALSAFGADRIMFSVDYPFGSSDQATGALRSAPLAPADREKIAHGNAESLLRL